MLCRPKNFSKFIIMIMLSINIVLLKKATFWELFDYLKAFVDLSDPDINLTNHQHLFQTAEGLRKDGFPDWMQLVGLIHDLGKIIYRVGNDSDELV